jgi:hypothetical protein
LFFVVRVSECGSNETAFTEIQSDFMEKSRFIRDFSFAKNPKPENGKLRLFVGKWTAAASLGAMEAAASFTLVLHPSSEPGKPFSMRLV